MKPIATLAVMSRDPMDPSTLTRIGFIEIDACGEGTIILTRDEMGAIVIENVDLKPTKEWPDAIDEATKTLSELHAKIGEMQVATNHAMSDMFHLHKLLTR